ncbi:MAG: erythromycin esterase family protein [Bacteroidales bacterium]
MPLFNKNATNIPEKDIIDLVQRHSHDLDRGLEPLLEKIGDARIVLLGEASHGTHEYYLWRSRITQRLVKEKGFKIIGVEGDWPDCYQINRYIRHYADSRPSAVEVLKEFDRWPSWMWANWEIAALMEWLKKYNSEKPFNQQTGFYGLDVYSLWESLEAIIEYVRKHDPDATAAAVEALQCFEPYQREGSTYASAARFVPDSCKKEVLDVLRKIRMRVPMYNSDPEAPFSAEQNAMTAVNAERYYRSMIEGGPESWNIRDTHMTDTLEKLLDFHGPDSRAIVWEHNTHIGDARATGMSRSGMVNVGQLVREKWGRSNSVLVGFGSYEGSVIAGRGWGSSMEEMEVPPAREDSWEAILHQSDPKNKLIITSELRKESMMTQHLNHRAIGVVYDPELEYRRNYVPSLMTERYDAFLFLDKSQGLHPVKGKADVSKTPETYPWGI